MFAETTLTQKDDQLVYPEPRFQTYGRLDGRIVLAVRTPNDAGLRVI